LVPVHPAGHGDEKELEVRGHEVKNPSKFFATQPSGWPRLSFLVVQVSIAPLPPRLVPQSKLGLGLAVHLLLSRFDDHLSYYALERNFLERFGAVIPRQQMVQWVEKVAPLLLAIYWLIWEELKAGDYLQIDESPVKVLDPEVKGKAAQGYLWFYSQPAGYVFLEFNPIFATGGCMVAQVPENQGWLGKGL
jgi:hypothetical protein